MLDTVLNLGLNDRSVRGLIERTDNERFGWDSYRRFVQMFGSVVRDIEGELFEDAIKTAEGEDAAPSSTRTSTRAPSSSSTGEFKQIFAAETGEEFPQEPREQLRQAIRAVFDSWNGERAVALPAPEPHPRRVGNRGQRAADGVRQQGRHLGVGRRLQPQPDDWRAAALRRLPPERAGRGRRLRRAQHARPLGARRAAAGGARPADRHHADARAPLPRHAGHRVHDRGRNALHAADPQREAPGAGRGAGRGRHGGRGGADPGGGAAAHRRGQARGAAASDLRPELLLPAAGARRPGLARRGQGQHRVHRLRGGRAGARTATR